jgi:exodeoxyribonuclease V beta subunit
LKTFDIIHSPLSGTNLIEASAGTGKTYTIEGLFVRLILEKQLLVDQILVVTFTNAATEELRDRIRNKLLQAKEAFSKESSADPLIDAVMNHYENPVLALHLIHEALINFDRAAIFTIHGFCQRILYENAFETGKLFDTELVTDQSEVIQEVVDDFWRKHFYNAPLEFVNYATPKIKGPKSFSDLFSNVKTSDVRIIPQLDKPSLGNLQPFRKAFRRLKRQWSNSRESIIHALKCPELSGTYYGSLKPDPTVPHMTKRDLKILFLVESMDRFVDSKSNGFPLFKDFEKFATPYLSQSTRKNQIPPTHDFFDICEEVYRFGKALESECDHYLLFLKTQLFRFANLELTKRKKNKNIHYFDDLLILVKNALEANGGGELADTVRQKYKAALVDEFQDTDNVQYDIFTQLFSSKDHLLFMIGDPKQAIYGFRGADIFSYMKASRNVASKFTLMKNWRSDPGLITAVNTIFSNVNMPFVFDEIPFEKGRSGKCVSAGGKNNGMPLIMWYLNSRNIYGEEKIISKTDAVQLIAGAVAEEICRLISPGPSNLARGDIAVLVRTNKQAQLIKHHLSSKGIPSVLYSTGNIFDSQEAMELEIILTSISEPGNIANLKAALVMDMMGVNGEELVFADQDTLWWERRLTNIQEYYRVWNQHGFTRMFRLFLANENIKERLISFLDGERRLTNVLHLAEILHHVSIEKNLGITGLIKWLAEQRDPSSPRLEEHQLRLESDEHAVTIVTIHKSKGLEYPVVFCPFGWESSSMSSKEIVFHDIDQDMQLTFDLGTESRSKHLTFAQNERLAENLRLLYVALTRAKWRCYLAWGRINTAETSAMAYLFHGRDIAQGNLQNRDIVESLKESFTAKTEDEILADLDLLARQSKGSIRLTPLPMTSDRTYSLPQDQQENLLCRKFLGKIDHTWKISSYSSLVSSRAADIDLPDYDGFQAGIGRALELLSDDVNLSETSRFNDIFSFPKGSRAGIFFHDLFEHLNFAEHSQEYVQKIVAKKLQEYGFEKMWQKTICKVITNVLNTPLRAGSKDFTLSNISLSDRINEMEFYFPLNPVTPQLLEEIFKNETSHDIAPEYPAQLEKLIFAPTAGFMKGFIDLVFHHQGKFYIIDWKSNYLGSTRESYTKESLIKAIEENLYFLQYHLYTLALCQYLRRRKPDFNYDTDFGGVFYIFIRGVDVTLNSTSGVFDDFPPRTLIDRLGEALIPDF